MNTWTLIGLIRCEGDDGNQATLCISMFEDILSRTLPAGISMVVWLDFDVTLIPKLDPQYVFPGPGEPLEGQLDTCFYTVVNDPSSTGPRKSRLVRLRPNIDTPNIRNPVHVQQFLTHVTSSAYAGKQNLLVCWGHGTSYGVFYADLIFRPNVRYNMLDGEGLQHAISGAFSNQSLQKVNVVITVSCFTNFFDTCLALAASGVEYLVAAPNGNSFVGYNYSVILDQLFSHPDMSPRDLAKLAVNSIPQPGSNLQVRLAELKNKAIYADDLAYCNQVGIALNDLGVALMQEMAANIVTIDEAVDLAPAFSQLYWDVDLYRFVNGLQQSFGPGWQATLINRLKSLKAPFHIAAFIGNGFQRPSDIPQGVTVFLPKRKTNPADLGFYKTYFQPDSPFPSLFASGAWAQFVMKYVFTPTP